MDDAIYRIKNLDLVGFAMALVKGLLMAASADVWVLFELGPVLFLFASVLMVVHLIVILGLGRLAGLDISEFIIGSTACVGRVISVTAIASAKG